MGAISNIIGDQIETKFAQWLNGAGIPFFYVGQKKTIPSTALLTTFKAKRPDYVILIQKVGMFLVDVKGIKLFRLKMSFDIHPEDFYHYFNLEKHFNFKIFLTFYDASYDSNNFYWISLSRISMVKIEDRIKNTNGTSHSVFRIPLNECVQVGVKEDFQSFFNKFQSLK